jgi:hypothetical protein
MIWSKSIYQFARSCGGEDGLAEAFEDGRDLFQPLPAGVDFCK